jgi:hypothetical protein
LITDKLPDIKPGVSARAEIVITNLTDALTVPIQSVSTHKGKQVVFLATAPQEPVPVTVGMYNTRLIQITAGLKEGDRVLLAPPVDPKEKDLGGAIIGESESASEAATNQSHTPALPTPAVPANSEPGGSAPAKVPATVLEKRSTRVADVKP